MSLGASRLEDDDFGCARYDVRMRVLVLIFLAAIAACSSPEPKTEAPAKPNIVIILADDLGYADVSFNGGDIKTPNIDRIAAEGVKLERFYMLNAYTLQHMVMAVEAYQENASWLDLVTPERS